MAMDGKAIESERKESNVVLPLSSAKCVGNVQDSKDSREDTEDVISFLTLGDGDFSYSLDLARYLASSDSFSSVSSTQTPLDDVSAIDSGQEASRKKSRSYLIVTGIDSHDELIQKYKDAPFFLRQLQAMNKTNPNGSQTNRFPVDIEIVHGINAIVDTTDRKHATNHYDGADKGGSAEAIQSTLIKSTRLNEKFKFKSDHVIFNHPHLGREDAELHSRLLCHLLHSAAQFWMKPSGGVFHLTLARGQYERWNCHEAAERNGLVLLEQNEFRPPPPPSSNTNHANAEGGITSGKSGTKKQRQQRKHRTYYQYRRHQTGKSFESRRAEGGSETFTFGRANDSPSYVATCLPWQHTDQSLQLTTNDNQQQEPHQPTTAPLPCPYCTKVFVEERSRKCHIRDKHKEDVNTNTRDSKKQKQEYESSQLHHQWQPELLYYCELCQPDESGSRRQFPSAQALQDHMQAVHTARHKNILPDWSKNVGNATATSTAEQGVDDVVNFGSCAICGLVFREQSHARQHGGEFVPPNMSSEEEPAKFQCSFCSKTFREDRARKQHENFCPLQTHIKN